MATINKRVDLGRPLTNVEIDQNFENLNAGKAELSGTAPMTGNLQTPGAKATSLTNGLRIYNFEDELVATFGANGSQDLVIEGALSIKGQSNNNDINVRNLFVNGRIISTELRYQYNVSSIGDVYRGTAAIIANKLVVTLDAVVKIIDKVGGNFVVGEKLRGQTSLVEGIVTKVTSDTVYVKMTTTGNNVPNPNSQFTVGETLIQIGSAITAKVYDVINTNKFDKDFKVKTFGASATNVAAVDAAMAFTASKVGTLPNTATYYYWITQYAFATGRISAAVQVTAPVSQVALSSFNTDNNIKLTLARTNVQYGIAVYRGTSNVITEAKLIDVLGPDDLGSNTSNINYTDYGINANTPWSTKDSSFGSYTLSSGMVHFPLTPNTTTLYGWKNFTVDTNGIVDKSTIRFTENALINTGGFVELAHNNTEGIQLAIDTNKTLGLNNLIFPNGTYYTSRLNLPDDFSLIGSGEQSIIKQLPWNFDHVGDVVTPQNKGNIIKGKTTTPKNITVKDIKIDGNIVNNIKFAEIGSNYVISLANGTNIAIDKVKIQSVVGGGLYLSSTTNLRVQDCDILEGSVSYNGNNLAPIFASDSSRITITNNVCENFVSPLDVSTCNTGVVVGNTVKNCGSGLLVYGSGSLLSSPNLLMGPSNEYLPSPDTQDSDWNSVNITINPNIDYTSPSYLYMTRGEPLHLGTGNKFDSSLIPVAIPGTSIDITSDIFVLTKLNNAEEKRVAWDYSNNSAFAKTITVASSAVNISTEIITATAHNLNTGDKVKYTTSGSGTVIGNLTNNSNYFVIVVTVNTIKLALTYANALAGSSINLTSVGTGNHTFTNNSPIINIITPNEGDFGRNNGYFQFRVNQVNSLALPTLSQLITTHGASLVAGEQIVGLVYRINGTGYTYTDFNERILIDSGEFTASGVNKYYTITLKETNNWPIFNIGDGVKIFGHSTKANDVVNQRFTVVEKPSNGKLKLLVPLDFTVPDPSVTLPHSVPDSSGYAGYITIENTITLAQGRIL
jgi:hypothetical protein